MSDPIQAPDTTTLLVTESANAVMFDGVQLVTLQASLDGANVDVQIGHAGSPPRTVHMSTSNPAITLSIVLNYGTYTPAGSFNTTTASIQLQLNTVNGQPVSVAAVVTIPTQLDNPNSELELAPIGGMFLLGL